MFGILLCRKSGGGSYVPKAEFLRGPSNARFPGHEDCWGSKAEVES
jgi:hypothetical protein